MARRTRGLLFAFIGTARSAFLGAQQAHAIHQGRSSVAGVHTAAISAAVPPFARRRQGSMSRLCMVASPPEAETSTAASDSTRYDPSLVEPKWQDRWEAENVFAARRREGKEKKYVLDMFPYPSGAGLHVGHPEGYTASDIMARYWRMKDYDVLHPMGWDAFGLPAEQHAINTGTHPEQTTKENIANFKRQLRSLGFSYDWGRELATTDVGYVKWTQWIFLQLFKKDLAFQSEVRVNCIPASSLARSATQPRPLRHPPSPAPPPTLTRSTRSTRSTTHHSCSSRPGACQLVRGARHRALQ